MKNLLKYYNYRVLSDVQKESAKIYIEMCSNVLYGFLFWSFVHMCSSQVSTGDGPSCKPNISIIQANFITRKTLMDGLIVPREIYAVVGEDISFQISEPVKDQTRCLYRMPGGKDENILSPHKNK